jgi:hypothetical protein
MIDDLAALRATVDVIAERDDLEGPLGGILTIASNAAVSKSKRP